MIEEIYKRLVSGQTLRYETITPVERKQVIDLFQRNGMSPPTIYHRIFKIGFDQWEIEGINNLRNHFLLSHVPCYGGTDEEGARGYGYVLSLSKQDDADNFYEIVCQLGADVKLCHFMAQRGMKSMRTVRKRFKAKNWKPWELRGVRVIFEEAIQQGVFHDEVATENFSEDLAASQYEGIAQTNS